MDIYPPPLFEGDQSKVWESDTVPDEWYQHTVSLFQSTKASGQCLNWSSSKRYIVIQKTKKIELLHSIRIRNRFIVVLFASIKQMYMYRHNFDSHDAALW